MTVGELIKLLQEYTPERPVELITQPNYPMRYEVEGVADGNDLDDEDHEDHEDKVYLVEGDWIGYGNEEAWNRV